MIPFIFVRHGETDWNLEGRFQGRTDIPLNQTGVQQALHAAKILADTPINLIVSSPLSRAHETARTIANTKDLPVLMDDDLVECDFGKLEGQSIAAAMKEFGLQAKDQLPSILPPDAEPWIRVRERSLAVVKRHTEFEGQHSVVFVGHDAILQSLCEQFCGRWIDSKHGVPYLFDGLQSQAGVTELGGRALT